MRRMGGEEGGGGGGVGGETRGLEGGRGLFCFNHSRSVSHYLTSPCTPEECVWENRGRLKSSCVCVCVFCEWMHASRRAELINTSYIC